MTGAAGPSGELTLLKMSQLIVTIVRNDASQQVVLQGAVDADIGLNLAFAAGALVFDLSEPDAVPRVFEGVCGGRILEEPRGQGGFGYDSLFFSDELARTFGEATAEEKDAVSHRGRAVRAFAEAVRQG